LPTKRKLLSPIEPTETISLEEPATTKRKLLSDDEIPKAGALAEPKPLSLVTGTQPTGGQPLPQYPRGGALPFLSDLGELTHMTLGAFEWMPAKLVATIFPETFKKSSKKAFPDYTDLLIDAGVSDLPAVALGLAAGIALDPLWMLKINKLNKFGKAYKIISRMPKGAFKGATKIDDIAKYLRKAEKLNPKEIKRYTDALEFIKNSKQFKNMAKFAPTEDIIQSFTKFPKELSEQVVKGMADYFRIDLPKPLKFIGELKPVKKIAARLKRKQLYRAAKEINERMWGRTKNLQDIPIVRNLTINTGITSIDKWMDRTISRTSRMTTKLIEQFGDILDDTRKIANDYADAMGYNKVPGRVGRELREQAMERMNQLNVLLAEVQEATPDVIRKIEKRLGDLSNVLDKQKFKTQIGELAQKTVEAGKKIIKIEQMNAVPIKELKDNINYVHHALKKDGFDFVKNFKNWAIPELPADLGDDAGDILAFLEHYTPNIDIKAGATGTGLKNGLGGVQAHRGRVKIFKGMRRDEIDVFMKNRGYGYENELRKMIAAGKKRMARGGLPLSLSEIVNRFKNKPVVKEFFSSDPRDWLIGRILYASKRIGLSQALDDAVRTFGTLKDDIPRLMEVARPSEAKRLGLLVDSRDAVKHTVKIGGEMKTVPVKVKRRFKTATKKAIEAMKKYHMQPYIKEDVIEEIGALPQKIKIPRRTKIVPIAIDAIDEYKKKGYKILERVRKSKVDFDVDDYQLLLNKYKFPKEVEKELHRYLISLSRVEVFEKVPRQLRSVVNSWKGIVTVPWPRFHMRNAISNVVNNMFAGLVSPKPYKKSLDAQVLIHKIRHKIPLTEADRIKNVVRTVDGKTLELTRLYDIAERGGLIGTGFWGEELGRVFEPTREFTENLMRGKLVAAGRQGGEFIETNSKFAMFLDRILKGDTVDDALYTASRVTYNYRALTPTVKGLRSTIFPFLTWRAKNLMYHTQNFLKNPGVYRKLDLTKRKLEDMQNLIFGPDNITLEQIRDKQALQPSWLRWSPSIRFMNKKGEFNHVQISDLIPAYDMLALLQLPRALRTMIIPLISIPIQQMEDFDWFRGRDITNTPYKFMNFLGLKVTPRFYHALSASPLGLIDRLLGPIFGSKYKKGVFGNYRPQEKRRLMSNLFANLVGRAYTFKPAEATEFKRVKRLKKLFWGEKKERSLQQMAEWWGYQLRNMRKEMETKRYFRGNQAKIDAVIDDYIKEHAQPWVDELNLTAKESKQYFKWLKEAAK